MSTHDARLEAGAAKRTAAARFANDRVWQLCEGTPWTRKRLEALAGCVPADIRSVLEVGCGSGQVARAARARLADGARVVGVDRARPGLIRFRATTGAALVADADALPFANRSFELVICSEVLEHLPDAVLASAVAELRRVAQRDVLISVPNEEDLQRELMLCRRCGAAFNAYGHLRRFDLALLDALIGPEFLRVSQRTAGPRRPYHPWLLAARRALGRYYWEPTAVCATCGNRDFPNRERDPLRLLCDALNVAVNPRRRGEYWLVARYRRRVSAP